MGVKEIAEAKHWHRFYEEAYNTNQELITMNKCMLYSYRQPDLRENISKLIVQLNTENKELLCKVNYWSNIGLTLKNKQNEEKIEELPSFPQV